MLIRITGRAEVVGDDGMPVTGDRVIRKLDGAEADDLCSLYLSDRLADLGILGGIVKLTYDKRESRFLVVTEYTSPVQLTPTELKRLTRETAEQWSDGVGKVGFDRLAERLNVAIDLSVDDEEDLKTEQIDDGKSGPRVEAVLAKAARKGDLAAVRQYLDAGADMEARLQGCTALHWAVLYGRVEVIAELIARGANLNARDPLGNDSLMLAALSHRMSDATSARIAKMLLERGVPVHGPHGPEANPRLGETTPLHIARQHNRSKLAAVLEEFGAVG